MTVIVRTAGRGDISAVDALLARAYPILLKPDYPPSVLVTALPIISRAQPELVTSGTYAVAELDGALVGAGGWTFAAPGRGRSLAGQANVRHLVTDDRHVRKGIARALMTHVLAEAQGAGAQWMHCLSTLTAEPFYAAVGFRSLGPVTVPLAGGIDFPAVEMRLDF